MECKWWSNLLDTFLQNSTYFNGNASLCLGRIILAINVFNFRDLKALLGKHCFMATVLKLSVVRCRLEKCNYPSENFKKCTK